MRWRATILPHLGVRLWRPRQLAPATCRRPRPGTSSRTCAAVSICFSTAVPRRLALNPRLSPVSASPHCCDRAGSRAVISNGCRSEEHTSELQSRGHLVCRLLLEKKKKKKKKNNYKKKKKKK